MKNFIGGDSLEEHQKILSKIRRSDRCWCGSAKKYKHCHLGRQNEEAYQHSRIEYEIRDSTNHKCLHPNASAATCSPGITDSHTVQRNGPLKALVDETNHLLRFTSPHKTGFAEAVKISWYQASTFKGYCQKHDNELFSPIEKGRLYTGTCEQNLAAGYRAYSFEYFKKKVAILENQKFLDIGDRGFSPIEQYRFQRENFYHQTGLLDGQQKLRETLNRYKNCQPGDLQIESLSIFYETQMPAVAVCGAFAPDCTKEGNLIERPDLLVPNISINTLPTEDGFCIVFTWPSVHSENTIFAKSLLEYKYDQVSDVLITIIFSFLNNSYFSLLWYRNLNDSQKNKIIRMASIPNMYKRPLSISHRHFVDWKITDIRRNRSQNR